MHEYIWHLPERSLWWRLLLRCSVDDPSVGVRRKVRLRENGAIVEAEWPLLVGIVDALRKKRPLCSDACSAGLLQVTL